MDGVVLLGNAPMLRTGYSTQLEMIGQALNDAGYAVAHVCDFGYAGHMFNLNGVDVYGCDELPGKLTSATLKNHIRDWRKQYMIDNWCLIGLGNFHNWGDLLAGIGNTLLIAPVDGDGLKPEDMAPLSSVSNVAGLTPHGVEILSQHFDDVLYLPHGYNPELQMGRGHRAVRATATFKHSTECFLVGFLGDMTIRKAPSENLKAFAKFSQGKPDVRLWIKESSHPQAVQEIAPILQSLPYGTVISTSEYDSKRGLSTEEMRELLIGLDVLLHCSSQEGFGIYQIEAQAVGTPIISTGHGSTKHLNAHADLVVVPKQFRTANGVQYPVPDVEEIVVRLETLYEEWKTGKINKRTPQCIQWAKQWSFDAVKENVLKGAEYLLQQSKQTNLDQPELLVRKPRKHKRVAFLSTYKTNCGIATYTNMLAESLVAQGEEVIVLAEATEDEPIGTYEIDTQIKMIRCWDRKFDAAGALKSALEEFKPDVIHVQHEWAMFSRSREIWEVLRTTDLRVVFTYHTPDFVSEAHEGAFSHLLAHSSIADAVITHNAYVCEAIRGKVFPPVAHIPHGIMHHSENKDARQSTNVPKGVPMLLNFGFASESKGTLDLINALGIVAKNNNCPYFETVIFAGAHPHWDVDPYLQQCEKTAKKIPGLTFVREFLDDDKLDVMLSACDFVVFPYSGVPGHEILSTSGAVMRSLGAGKPVICTDEGRLRDLVGGVHGLKASRRNPEALAKAIEEAVNIFHSNKSGYAKMSDAVLSLAAERTWGLVANKHQQLYDRVTACWSVRPDRVMPIQPVWIEHDARDILQYESVESEELEEE